MLAALVLVSGCAVLQGDCSRPEFVCAGLVTGYGRVEAGIEHQAWLALQDAKASGSVDRVAYIETVDTRDRSANVAYFGNADYDIVVATGAGIAAETASAARQHPNTLFVTIQPGHEPLEALENLVRLEFKEDQAGFLAGAAAAMITQTHHVAAVCEARFIDYIERYCEGFAAGAKYVDKAVEATVNYRTGPEESLFRDSEWGQAAATQAIDDGADVIFAVGEATARAALLQAAGRGAVVIGAQTDVYEEEPEIRPQLVTSATLGVRQDLSSLLGKHLNTQLPSGTVWGSVGLAPFYEYETRIAPEVKGQLLRIQTDLESGVLQTRLGFEGR